MKSRILAALVAAAALLASAPGAQAGPPVMDGKKVKVITWKANGGLQDNTADAADREYCTDTCGRYSFVYKPAKGAKGGLMFTATWTNPVSDVDLLVAVAGPKGQMTVVGACQGAGQPKERVYLSPTDLKPGKTYVMIMYYWHSVNETFNGKIEMGVPNDIPTTVPTKVDATVPTNCTI